MTAPYTEVSAASVVSSVTPPGAGQGHLRRRSSVTSPTRITPFISHMVYDEKTGEISLPPSPPLYSWKEKDQSALGLYHDEKTASSKPPRLPPYAWSSEPTRKLTRPWITVLTVAGCTISLFVLLSYLVPEGSRVNQTILSRIPFKLSSTCNPYAAFGSLKVDPNEPDNNQYLPFDPKCRAPSFLAKLRADSNVVHGVAGSKTTQPTTDFSWMFNKTVLLIGDSVDREHVENFCQLMGLEAEVVRKTHRFAPNPTPVRSASKSVHSVEKPERLGKRGFRVVRDAGLPRICYVPKYDFMLASVFHFGLDQEDYWRGSRMPQYSSPGMFEHRLTDVIQPFLANIRASGRPSAPDYVEVSSASWDLARWAEEDIDAMKETENALMTDRVTWYRFRVGQVLEKVRKAFPLAKAKTWRTMHYPLDQVAEHDYFMDKINTRTTNTTSSPPPPSFPHNRISQLDQAVRTLVLPTTDVDGRSIPAPHSDFRLNEWGRILKGHEAHQKDRLHGDPIPGGYLWADIMLYELHHGVKISEAQPMRALDSPLY
ncbi:Proteophosphoglycan 5 [Meredithblackwellia eburnea MCA 4105]